MSYRKYTEEMLRDAVKNSDSFVGVVRYLNIKTINSSQSHIARMIRKFDIDHSHFVVPKINDRIFSNRRLTAQQILIRLPEGSSRVKSTRLRRALKEMGVEEKCSRCSLGNEWQDQFIQLEINHIDGDSMNCLFDNLEFICPNCHSQETETNLPHKNKNK